MRTIGLLLTVAALSGCSTTLIRVAGPEGGEGKPALEETIDLGGLPLQATGELSQGESDDRCTPGEVVALVGQNLHAATAVSVGGRPATVEGYLQGGSLLIRVPRGLSAGKQPVAVETPGGVAGGKVEVSYYAFGADTHSDTLHFRRFGPERPGFEEDAEFDIELGKARFQELSPDGALLYAVQKEVIDTGMAPSAVSTAIKAVSKIKSGAKSVQLLVVHMGAKDAPEELHRFPITLSSNPTGMAVGAKTLVLLQKRQLTLLDTSNPTHPQLGAVLELGNPDSECELVDAVFLDDGRRWLVVLEAYQNALHLVDLANPSQPKLAGSTALSKAVGQPFSIDLELSPDRRSVWVLQGPNMRLAGKRLLDGVKGVWRDAKRLEFKQAAGTAGDALVGATMQNSICRLVEARPGERGLEIANSIPLPHGLFPYFVKASPDGTLYVSGMDRHLEDFSRLEANMDGLMALIAMLKDAVHLGQVIRVDPRSGKSTIHHDSVAIYYDMAILPGDELLTSVIRLGPGYLPPRVTLDWGFEARGEFTELREIANSTTSLTDAIKKLLPPYDYERIGVQ